MNGDGDRGIVKFNEEHEETSSDNTPKGCVHRLRDYFEDSPYFTRFDLCMGIANIVQYSYDMATDYFLVVIHYLEGEKLFFGIYLAFVILTYLGIVSLCCAYYIDNKKVHTKWWWVSRFFFPAIGLGAISL